MELTDFCLKYTRKANRSSHPWPSSPAQAMHQVGGLSPMGLATAGCLPRSVSGSLGFQQPLCCSPPPAPPAIGLIAWHSLGVLALVGAAVSAHL